MKKIIITLIVLILIAGAGFGGYWYGISKNDSLLVSNVTAYPKIISGFPSIPELNSVSQDAITFRTGLNGIGHDEIAGILDKLQDALSINFDRSYSGNTLNWYRFDNVSYSDWVGMPDSEKIASKKAISRLINKNPGEDMGHENIEYYMDAIIAKIDNEYSLDDASGIIKNIHDYLVDELDFISDDAVFDDYFDGVSPHTLIRNNLVCKIDCEIAESKDWSKDRVNEINLTCGYYDEPVNE